VTRPDTGHPQDTTETHETHDQERALIPSPEHHPTLRAAAIEAVEVTRSYRFGDTTVDALRGVTFTVAEGEYAAIVGPSGSGKSTLMHLLGCLDRPTSGILRVGGRNIADLGDAELAELRNKEIGFVFQAFQLLPRSSAIDNVALPLLYRGVKGGERRELAAEALKAVNLGHRLTHRPTQMSGGEQQRVAIARALVGEPRILLADEPTGNLDSKNGAEVMRILEELNSARGVAVVLVTHDDEVAGRARRQVRVRDGLVERDTADGAGA
jgi:putative ABC transport system ATP-binding protein